MFYLSLLMLFTLVSCGKSNITFDKIYQKTENVYLDGTSEASTAGTGFLFKNIKGEVVVFDSDGTQVFADKTFMGVTLRYAYKKRGNVIRYTADKFVNEDGTNWIEFDFVSSRILHLRSPQFKKENIKYYVFKLQDS